MRFFGIRLVFCLAGTVISTAALSTSPERNPRFVVRPTTTICVGAFAEKGINETQGDTSNWMAQRFYPLLNGKFGRQIPGVPKQGQRVWPYAEKFMQFCGPSSETIFVVAHFGYKDGKKFLVRTIVQQYRMRWENTTFNDAEGNGLKPASIIINPAIPTFERQLVRTSQMVVDLIEFEGF